MLWSSKCDTVNLVLRLNYFVHVIYVLQVDCLAQYFIWAVTKDVNSFKQSKMWNHGARDILNL